MFTHVAASVARRLRLSQHVRLGSMSHVVAAGWLTFGASAPVRVLAQVLAKRKGFVRIALQTVSRGKCAVIVSCEGGCGLVVAWCVAICSGLSCTQSCPSAQGACLDKDCVRVHRCMSFSLHSQGAKLVPVIGFGENDLFDVNEPGPLRLWLNRWTKTLFGFTLPSPVGQGLFWGE